MGRHEETDRAIADARTVADSLRDRFQRAIADS
jgi:hypothetical protein